MIYVIGIGISGRHSLTGSAVKTINGAGLLAGGKRHLDEFPDFTGAKVPVGSDLGVAAARIRRYLKNRRGKDVVILATGDPLLFGIADFIIKRFGKGRVEIIPNLSTVQVAFARIKESSNGLKVLSAHGRGVSMDELAAEILGNDRVAIFTDPQNTPSKIAGALLRRGVKDASVYVCEALGTSEERIRNGTPATFARARKFHPLNIMIIIKRDGTALRPSSGRKTQAGFGIPDTEFIHSRGMITKEEVRAVALSKMRLDIGSIVWDIGAGCGSVAIEAARFSSGGRVFAFEKDKRRARQIKHNKKRFGADNLEIITGAAPVCLKDKGLLSPDAVFIGGGGADINCILGYVSRRIRKGGRIVVNAVTMETAGKASSFFRDKDWETGTVLVSLSRTRPAGDLSLLGANNPVFIITGIRP